MYCSSHVPKSGPGHLDNTSVGIRQALNVPRTNKFVNEQIRGTRHEIDGKYKLPHNPNNANIYSFTIINFYCLLVKVTWVRVKRLQMVIAAEGAAWPVVQ